MPKNIAIGFILILFSSCTYEEKNVVVNSIDYFYIPEGFPAPVYDLSENFDLHKFELGKKLFFDPLLSIDTTISCSSCHKQENAFSDKGNALSAGIKNQKSIRNSPALINLAWQPFFMWDGGVNHIEVQPLAPLTNPLEMGSSLTPIVERLNQNTEYKKLFQETFKTDSITSANMFIALAHYMSCLISSNSKYDQFIAGKLNLSPEEQEGLYLFQANCSGCHPEPLFTDFSYRNNGIGITNEQTDAGRFIITQKNEDSLKFKIPALRNIELTFPYMHDGRIKSLEEVIEHYTSGNFHKDADPLILQIKLDSADKKNLLYFLKTLTDKEFITNKNYHL